MRLPYWRFANVVERARREVVREFPGCEGIHVIALSGEDQERFWFDTDEHIDGLAARYGEFVPPAGPIIVYQFAIEQFGIGLDCYQQVKSILRHEFGHAQGETHGEPIPPIHPSQAVDPWWVR